MDFLQELFFERPMYLAVFSFLLFAVVLFTRRRMTGAAARWSLPGVLALIFALFIIQGVVVTQRELIQQALDRFVEAIAAQDMRGVERGIGEGYNSEKMDRKDIVEFMGSAMESTAIYDTRFSRRDVTVTGDQADMTIAAWATVRFRSGPGEYHQGRWRIGWAREQNGWKIVSMRPEMIDLAPIDGLFRLRSHMP